MPSIEESRRQVRETLEKHTQEPDHDDIIASLQDEIDRHNAVKDSLRDSIGHNRRRNDQKRTSVDAMEEPSLKFRFKATHSDPRKRKHRDRDHHNNKRHHKRRRKEGSESSAGTGKVEDEGNQAHPFPREPTDQDQVPLHPNHAFRDSLFDALADDEGAQYWESVYSQPIHIYTRPTIATPRGELEEMDDDAYVAYVKTKMWERKHPEILIGRERTERKRKEAEERSAREREDFIRRKEQAAWAKGQTRSRRSGDGQDGQYERTFAGENKCAWQKEAQNGAESAGRYTRAWATYLAAWDGLKHDFLRHATNHSENDKQKQAAALTKRIPWPVLAPKPVLKPNIEAFMSHVPASQEQGRLQLLKAERVRWHPDKIQQRFGGNVDEGTMKLVTGVFQVVDALYEDERKRAN